MNHSPSRFQAGKREFFLGLFVVLAIFGLIPALFAADSQKVQINSEADLKNAINAINTNQYTGQAQVEFVFNDSIKLTQNLDEITVPAGSTTIFVFTSTDGKIINGNGYQGFVVSTTANSPISFENLQFFNCVAQGESGEDGKISGGGGGAGQGGAIYVKSGSVSLLDVKFSNNKAVGGDGGEFSPDGAANNYGDGGEPNGENGRASSGGGQAGFGGGGGGSPASDNVGQGGLGAGNGGTTVGNGTSGGTGGGGLGAGGAVFVEPGATLTVQYSDEFNSTAAFTNNAAEGGEGGANAENGDGIGNALFAGGNITFDTSSSSGGDSKTITMGKSQSIGGPEAATNFADYSEENLAEIKKYAGGVSVIGGGTLVLQGENTYLGKTEVDASTLIVENGKAISDNAEVVLKNGGTMELQTSETIGYLSGSNDSELRLYYMNDSGKKIGSKTLTIGGDEYSLGNPGNGRTILGDTITAFDGKIVTDHDRLTQERLIKDGTGLLILGGDNTNIYQATIEEEDGNGNTTNVEKTFQDDFATELRDGTLQLNHDKALGGGMLTVTSTDTEIKRNMLQTGIKSLKLDNAIRISTSTPFRVGVASELAADKSVVLDLAGQITGNSLMMNMANKDQVLKLSNLGVLNESIQDGTPIYSRTQTNTFSQVQLNKGTLAITGEQTTPGSDKWTTGLGNATLVSLLGAGSESSLRIDTEGLVVDNAIVVNSSGLTITNGIDEETNKYVSEFQLNGKISGTGGVTIDLHEKEDVIKFGGQLVKNGAVYEGVTDIRTGTLQFEQTTDTIRMSGELAISSDGVLDLNGNMVSFNGKGDYDLLGMVIDDVGTGSLIKAGTGTWNLNLQNTMNHLTVDAGIVVLKNATSVDNISIGKNGTLKLDANVEMQTLKGSTGSKLNVNDNELKLKGTGETFFGELLGGTDSKIVLEKGALPDGKTVNWELYGTSLTWTGTIDVREGANLRISAAGTLGKFEKSEASDAVGSVILNDSTLSVNTLNGPGTLGRLVIADNETQTGFGVVDVITNQDILYLYELEGDGDLVKNGQGNLYLIGENAEYAGDVKLNSGVVSLDEKAGLGAGKIISTGSDEGQRAIVVYANEKAESRILTNDFEIEQELTINYGDNPTLYLTGDVDGGNRLNFQGGGNIVLSGDYDAYHGNISIGNETYLQLGNTAGAGGVDLLHATVTVFSGATFNGSGTVNKIQVGSGGTLQLTSDTAKLRITEELYLDSGSILNIDCTGTVLGGTEKSGLITIGADGKAVLDGGVVYINAVDVQLGDTFTLINTEAGGTLEVNDLLSFRDNYDGARVVGSYDAASQKYTYKFVAFDYLDGMKTKNQMNLGDYLNYVADNAVMTPELSEMLSDLEAIAADDPKAGQHAYDEISGQIYATMSMAQIQGTSMLNQSLASQLRPGAFSGGTWDGYGDSYRGQTFADRGLSGWMSGYGMIGSVDSNANAAGYDLDVYGGMLGLERCSNNLSRRFGFYYGYGQTKVDMNNSLGKATSDDNRLGLYLKWDDRFGYGLMSGGVGFNSYKFDRHVLRDKIHSGVDGVQTSFYGERGASLRYALGTLQPFVGIQYLYQHQDGFDEHGSLLALSSNGVFTNSLRTMVGGRFVKGFGGGQRMMQWYLQGHWMHEYLDQNTSMTAGFTGITGPGFETTGTGMGRDWLVVGTGLELNLNSQMSFIGSYDAQFNDRTALHIGSIGAKIVW